MKKYSSVIARVFLAHIFILAGVSKLSADGFAGSNKYEPATLNYSALRHCAVMAAT